eukprot:TRINITY_DN50917_c0_g1_i2.p1 TRINITY_DN50917_c0_g1~~TRINITY_DN50917_c0_g1_i2.p1  ORF type:complete len:253 (-),score=46.16 TRINITY_DN50917_c0_g1_i2:1012-1770(-)
MPPLPKAWTLVLLSTCGGHAEEDVGVAPEWSLISATAACEENDEGIRRSYGGLGFTLETCRLQCEETGECSAIDFYADSSWCNLFKRPCSTPRRQIPGASSYRRVGSGHSSNRQEQPRARKRDWTALAVVPHFVGKPPKKWLEEAGIDASLRSSSLRRVLKELASYTKLPEPVHVHTCLVSNQKVEGVDNLVDEQIVVPRPRCSDTVQHSLCLPWEAIRRLKRHVDPGEPVPEYDYFLYLESDVMLPKALVV